MLQNKNLSLDSCHMMSFQSSWLTMEFPVQWYG